MLEATTRTLIGWPQYGSPPIGRTVDTGERECAHVRAEGSILIKSHGMPWEAALAMREQGVTHLAFCHADIFPQGAWLDALHAEMERTGVDVLSVLMPKKDGTGETSTAIECAADGKLRRRIITMREAQLLPATFTAADLHPGGWLLVNTGLMLARIEAAAWAEEVTFQHIQWVDRRQTPPVHDHESEDWYMSRVLHRHGVRVACTRTVKAAHRGTFDFPNQGAWGEKERCEWTDSHSIVPGLDPDYHPPGVIR